MDVFSNAWTCLFIRTLICLKSPLSVIVCMHRYEAGFVMGLSFCNFFSKGNIFLVGVALKRSQQKRHNLGVPYLLIEETYYPPSHVAIAPDRRSLQEQLFSSQCHDKVGGRAMWAWAKILGICPQILVDLFPVFDRASFSWVTNYFFTTTPHPLWGCF